MKTKKREKRFPVNTVAPVTIWAPMLGAVFFLVEGITAWPNVGMLIVCGVLSLICGFFAWTFLSMAIPRVEIHPTHIVYKGLRTRARVEVPLENCHVGMDYDLQAFGKNNPVYRKLWFIYVSQGEPPRPKESGPIHRFSQTPIGPGFLYVQYSAKVYEALMEVLPPRQQATLQYVRRRAAEDALTINVFLE